MSAHITEEELARIETIVANRSDYADFNNRTVGGLVAHIRHLRALVPMGMRGIHNALANPSRPPLSGEDWHELETEDSLIRAEARAEKEVE
jgi:hypothetical protein